MYYLQLDKTLIIMLGGGNKSSQAKDIVAARNLAATIMEG